MIRNYLYNLATDRYKGFFAGCIKALLFILSLIYGLGVRALILFYKLKPYRLNCRVISVGNITLGGTGKTSLVEYLARYLKNQGHKVAILSRGYKRKNARTGSAANSYESMGDEPYMLAKKLAGVFVIVDSDRIRGAKKAIKDYKADTVILDDGLQQWKIKKDLEIVTIDSTDPFGNQHMLPRGILREPLSSLRRADLFVLTKTNLSPDTQDIEDFLLQLNTGADIFESVHQAVGFYNINKPDELLGLDKFRAKTVTIFSGIGDPDSFENLTSSLGMKVGLTFRFTDHHNYTQQDLEEIVVSSRNKNIDTIITTDKDAARIQAAMAGKIIAGIFVLRIELAIINQDEERFHNRLLRLYNL